MYAIEPHEYLFDQYAIIDDTGQVIYQGLTFRQAVAVWKWVNHRFVKLPLKKKGDFSLAFKKQLNDAEAYNFGWMKYELRY